MTKIKALIAWVKDNVWLGRERGEHNAGWHSAVYLRVGKTVIHLGIERYSYD